MLATIEVCLILYVNVQILHDSRVPRQTRTLVCKDILSDCSLGEVCAKTIIVGHFDGGGGSLGTLCLKGRKTSTSTIQYAKQIQRGKNGEI